MLSYSIKMFNMAVKSENVTNKDGIMDLMKDGIMRERNGILLCKSKHHI